MPMFDVKGRDGDMYEVEATSESAAQRYVFNNTQPKKVDHATRKKGFEDALPSVEGDNYLSGTAERYLINLGAGFDTVKKGVQSMFGAPRSDADIEYDRDAKKVANASVPGGSLYEAAGEIAPTLAIPAGGFVRTAQTGGRVLKAGAEALGGTPTKLAELIAPAVRGGAGRATADAAMAGGAMGFANETKTDESRLENTIYGAVGGALLPAVIGGSMTVRDLITKGGAEKRAAQRLIDVMGGVDEAEAALQSIRNKGFGPPSTQNIPMTAAELSGDAKLFGEQMRAKNKFVDDWTPFTAQQNAARADSLMDITRGADNLEGSKIARDTVTDPIRERALQRAAKDPMMTQHPLVTEIASLVKGEARANPNTTKMLKYVQDQLDEGVSPAQLYRIRKTITDSLNGPTKIGDELSNAIKGSDRDALRLRDAIDKGLDESSKGAWSRYLEKYQSKSGEVNNAEASSVVRSFMRDDVPHEFGKPIITGNRIDRARAKAEHSDFGDRFDAKTSSKLDDLRDNLRMSEEIPALRKRVGTNGGGSDTAMNLFPEVLQSATGAMPIVGKVRNAIALKDQKAASDLLRDPDKFIERVQDKVRLGKPLDANEERMLRVFRTLYLGAPAAALAAGTQ